MSRRLGDGDWILQAPIGSRQTIQNSRADINCQHSAISETTVKQRPLAIIWFDFLWENPGFVGMSAVNTHVITRIT